MIFSLLNFSFYQRRSSGNTGASDGRVYTDLAGWITEFNPYLVLKLRNTYIIQCSLLALYQLLKTVWKQSIPPQALDKAKEAGQKERALVRQREQIGLTENINLDLTYSVLFNLAVQYEANEMYPEALNTYNVVGQGNFYKFRVGPCV